MLNAWTNVLFLFAIINAYSDQSDSLPIAEYCVGYGKKVFCSSYDNYFDYNCYNKTCDSVGIHLHLKTSFREAFRITTCVSYSSSDHDRFSNFANKFLIHDDLKVEAENVAWNVIWSSILNGTSGIIKGPNCNAKCEADSILKVFKPLYFSGVEWSFAEDVPVYVKNGKQIDFNKYYEKGKIVPVEWEFKASCGSLYDVTYSGSYFVRITGECE